MDIRYFMLEMEVRSAILCEMKKYHLVQATMVGLEYWEERGGYPIHSSEFLAHRSKDPL